MAKAKWRRWQERVAKVLLLQRRPLGRGQRARLESRDLVVVVRHRSRLPDWIRADLDHAIAHSGPVQDAALVLTADTGEAVLIISLDLG